MNFTRFSMLQLTSSAIDTHFDLINAGATYKRMVTKLLIEMMGKHFKVCVK